MFSLCEGNVSYSSIPLFRKRWFTTALFLGELWLLVLLYYLPFDLFAKFIERPLVLALPLFVFWACFLAIFCTGDVYALRKSSVYKIRLKFLFIFLHFLVLLLAAALVAGVVFMAPRYAPEELKNLFNRTAAWMVQLVDGSRVTLWLTILAVSAGLVMSLFLALGKMSKRFWVNRFCSAYVFFFRGTPLLMQLYFIYYGLPQITPVLTINNRFLAAFIAFSLNSAAYCAEIIRAAILSIDKGQFEASRALGLSYSQTMRLVIVPQSIRRLIPPVGNEFIMMLKDASLVSIIALTDITKVTRSISSSTASAMVYIPAMVLYLIITAVFTFIFHKLENKYSIYV
ncbi:MAG: amino acid ABC transporter permease [Spirochaetaceae bacterium]|jgi:polar amino acid transport system permease protein|nr:amino acid ABC transporter permease [Spirochaetaceae bacterium]